MRTRSEQIKASRAPKPVAKPNIKDYPNTKEGLARYDKALAAYNRYVKATGKPTPQTAQKAAQSGQYGRYAKPSNQVKLTPAKSADTKSAPKPASKPAASKPAPKPASKPAPAKPAPTKTTASKPASAPKSDKKRKSIAETLKELKRMKRKSKERQGKEPKMQGVGPYRSAKKYSAKMAGQPAKPAQAAKPNTKSKLRQAMEERMKKQRGRGY